MLFHRRSRPVCHEIIDLDLFEARSSNEQQRAQDYGFDTVDDSAGDADKVGDSADDSDCTVDSPGVFVIGVFLMGHLHDIGPITLIIGQATQ